MNRALRRHPLTTKQKRSRGGGSPAVLPRAPARPAAPRARRAGLSGLLGWRPRWIMDIISELRKVIWPNRQDTLHLTIVVIIVSLIIGAILGGIDVGFGWLIDKMLLQ